MNDLSWIVGWAIAVGVLGYVLSRAPSPWNWVVAVTLVIVLGYGSVMVLFYAIRLLA